MLDQNKKARHGNQILAVDGVRVVAVRAHSAVQAWVEIDAREAFWSSTVTIPVGTARMP